MTKATRDHAHRLLQCLTVAVRPLRLEELAEVLAFDFDDAPGGIPKRDANWRLEDQEQAVLSTCSSLITIVHDGKSRVVQFSHFSVKEFLTSDRLAAASADVSFHHIPLEPAHTILAQACLGVLLCLDDSTREASVKLSPLAEYAARHWVDHALFGNVSSHIKDGMENLFDLDKPHFSRWIKIHDMDSDGCRGTRPKLLEAAPVYYAALCGIYDVAEKLIIKHPEHIGSRGGVCGTALHAASRRNHLNLVQLLLEHSADVNAPDQWQVGWTPLHFASRWGYLAIGLLLLEYGADVNAKHDEHQTPLHLAADNGHLEFAQMLLKHNADVNSRAYFGHTPLHITSDRGHVDIARLLLEHGADIEALAHDGGREWTPLHVASRSRQLEIVLLLLECGANVNAKDVKHLTPLYLSAWNGSFKIVQTLLRHNADANAQAIDGDTPLHMASMMGYVDIVRLLLDHGADPEARGRGQKTPSHTASRHGQLEVAHLLLECGMNIDAIDDEGNSAYRAYQIALEGGYDKIIGYS